MRGSLQSDDGAVAAVVAIVLTVLLIVSAFIVDLGALRADHVSGKAIADMAAAAAVVDYEPELEGQPREACLEALNYAQENIPGATGLPVPVTDDSGNSLDCESIYPADYTCNPSHSRFVHYTYGSREIFIAIPVNSGVSDELGLMAGMDQGPEHDGEPCERVGVRIQRERSYLLAGFAGLGSGTTTPASVGLTFDGEEDEYPSLIVLDPKGCEALMSSGGDLTVTDLEHVDDDGNDVHVPGRITVDTLHDNCGTNKPVIHASSGKLEATGPGAMIQSFGKQEAPPAQYPMVYDAGNPRIIPQPVRSGPLITRSPIDYLVNCRDSYTNTTERWSPSHSESVIASDGIPPCDKGRPAYVEKLYSEIHSLGAPNANRAATAAMDDLRDTDWTIFPDDFDGQACNSASGTYGSDEVSEGRVYINCANSGPNLFKPQGLVFDDVALVVSRNRLDMGNSESFEISGSSLGTVLYFQRGGIDRTGGDINWDDVFVYLENGRVDMSGSGTLRWRAPLKEEIADECATETWTTLTPPAVCFAPVALWSNVRTYSTGPPSHNRMVGQAATELRGSFFTPNSDMRIGGGGGFALTGAQFFSRRVEMLNGTLHMTPHSGSTVGVPLSGTRLIR